MPFTRFALIRQVSRSLKGMIVPAALLDGKSQITVRFQATEGNQIAAVFGVRMVRGR